jgi:hypothetical protein
MQRFSDVPTPHAGPMTMRGTMRSRRILLMLAVVSCLTLTTRSALAQPVPSIADQPAATLLLPYFEVDLANPAGANTLFTVNNASAAAVLAHVTIWSAMHVPVYAFNVYLTGYDAQPMYVRDLLSGVLPQTASAGQDPSDAISPKGFASQDINFANCTGQLPAAQLPQATVDHIRNSLTGAASAVAGGMCASKPDGTRIARGYITVDTVNNCTTKLPSDAGYFVAGGSGDATNQNVLWGDAIYTNHFGGQEIGDGSPLVHIRADAVDPATATPGRYTFYGRLVSWTAADNREPLSTNFAVRYVSGGGFSNTSLTVWRDAKVSQTYFACSGNPSWYPLSQEGFSFFDEQEQVLIQSGIPFAPQPPSGGVAAFPAGTQRVDVGSAALATPYPFGWMYLNLNTFVTPAGAVPPIDPAAAQAWVEVHMKGSGRYSVGWPSAQLDSAKGAYHFYPH